MQKIVIHKGFGDFRISEKAVKFMANRGNKRAKKELESGDIVGYGDVDEMPGGYERNDPDLVAAVEELGKGAGEDLKIVEIPDSVKWVIQDYDGAEWIAEQHRTWR